MAHMTYGYQLVIHLPPNRFYSGESGQQWAMPAPVGNVSVSAVGDVLDDSPELIFRGGGFPSASEAKDAGETLRDWVRLTGAVDGGAFDVGHDLHKSGLGSAGRMLVEGVLSESDVFLVPDVHGLAIFEESAANALRFAVRAAGSVLRPSGALRCELLQFAEVEPLTGEQRLACDLVALACRESVPRLKMVTLATAMELLADDKSPGGHVAKLIERFIDEVEEERQCNSDDELGLQHLIRSLKNMRDVSISESLRILARCARPDAAEEAAVLVDRIYGCRSDLVHGKDAFGNDISEGDAAALWSEAFAMVKDMLLLSCIGQAQSRPAEGRP